MERELDLGAFRLLVRFTLLGSVALVVLGMYVALQGRWGWGLMLIGLGMLALVPSQYFRIRPEPGAENLLFLLSKPQCSLCDQARAVLRSATEGTPFTVQEIDILDDRRLRRRFKNHVPVVFWQGEELARTLVELDAVKERLGRILSDRARRPALQTS